MSAAKAIEATRKRLISAECHERIIAVADEEDQRNHLSYIINLERKTEHGKSLTTEEQSRRKGLIRLARWIDEMRETCKTSISNITPSNSVVWPEL